MTLAILCLFGFIAGLLDAMVGGGGLIQIPALLVCLPTATPAAVFGTNKLAAIVGTSVAVVQYAKKIKIPWKTISLGALTAFVGSFAGASVVSVIDPRVLRPLVLVLVVSLMIYTVKRKDFGSVEVGHVSDRARYWRIGALGASVGFYDGFFGPGTGSFFIVGMIALCGFSFLQASASAKLLNAGTNLSALIYFSYHGSVLYEVAIPMAVANAAGSFVGSHIAIAKGSRFVRVVFLIVCSALSMRLFWDLVSMGYVGE